MSAPTFVVASSSASLIALSWTAPTGAAKGGQNVATLTYQIQWDAGGGSSWATHQTPSGTSTTSAGLTGGLTYKYRIAASNKYGTGTPSPEQPCLAAQAPATPIQPVVTAETIYIRISWTAPSSNHENIDAYQILIIDSTGAFIEVPSLCNGADPTTRDSGRCLIQMTSLWAAPLSLPQGTEVKAKVLAHNVRGWSGTSPESTSGASIQTVPVQMSPPTRGSSTTDTVVQIDWVTVSSSPNDGGSAVLGYALYTDDGISGGSWIELDGYSALYTSNTYSITQSVKAGSTYTFKVMAKNKWGWGVFSDTSSTNGQILAATTPSQVPTATTSIDGATGGVTIVWTAPTSNGGVAITAYKIEIQSNAGAWNTDASCDGTTLVVAKTCTVPMASLVASPHSLAFDYLVVVRVSAENVRGFGLTSAVNTAGAKIRQVPAQMTSPTEGSQTSDSQIQVEWTAVSAAGLPTGNSAITEYELLWDNGDPSATAFLLLTLSSPLATSHIVVGVTKSLFYRFQIRGKNIYGPGAESAIQSIRASDVPSQMASASTVRSGTSLVLTWLAPSDNGAALTAYQITLKDRSAGDAYVEDTSICNGAESSAGLPANPLLSSRTCTFTFVYLMGTRGYAVGDLVTFIIKAKNDDGWGDPSAPNTGGATIMTIPVQMGAPTEGAATSHSQIQIDWSALTSTVDTGGTVITSYALEWDQGTGTWLSGTSALVGDPTPDTSTSFLISSGINAGNAPYTSYVFRVRANNAIGWGAEGPTVTIIPSSVPDVMATVTTSVENVYAKISWTAPNERGQALTAYEITIKNPDNTYTTVPSHCDGANILLNRYCLVPMAILSSRGLATGTLVEVKARAENIKGYGAESPVNAAGTKVENVPVTPGACSRIEAQTDETQVTVTWTALTTETERGGLSATIDSYNLEWRVGSSDPWVSLVGISPLVTATTFTATAAAKGTQPGQLYNFRVSAKNKYGWGPTGAETQVYAAAKPDAPAAPTTIQDGTNMRVTWVAPNNHGLAITSYSILVLAAASGGWHEPAACVTATVGTNLQCDIPMMQLRQSPFSLVLNDIVQAKVSATNLIGTGAESSPTVAGSQITTEPKAPPTPVLRGADTDDNQIQVQWTPLTGDDSGDDTPTMYEVYWTPTSGGSNWALFALENAATGFTYAFTKSTGISSGLPYQFYYRVTNQHGTGIDSAITTIYAYATPIQLGPAATANSGTNIITTWPATSSDRGSAVTGYRVKFKRLDGQYAELTSCTNSISPATARTCTTPMSDFTSSPFSLVRPDDIIAVVEAENAQGHSTVSVDSTINAQVQTSPTAGPVPSRGQSTADTEIEIDWTEVTGATETGGAAITHYRVFNDGGGTASDPSTWGVGTQVAISSASGQARSVMVQGLISGQSYRWAVSVENVHGEGPKGTIVSIIAADEPAAPTGLTAGTQTTNSLQFSWTPPTQDNGSAVTSYRIYWDQGAGQSGTAIVYVALAVENTTSYTATSLSSATGYRFRVAAINAVGTGQPSAGEFLMTTA